MACHYPESGAHACSIEIGSIYSTYPLSSIYCRMAYCKLIAYEPATGFCTIVRLFHNSAIEFISLSKFAGYYKIHD